MNPDLIRIYSCFVYAVFADRNGCRDLLSAPPSKHNAPVSLGVNQSCDP